MAQDVIDGFEFYPHFCNIYRGTTVDEVTGEETHELLYECLKCYLQEGITNIRYGLLWGEDILHLADHTLVIYPGDFVEVQLENGTVYRAKVKQAYPIKDPDFGGQDLKLYQRDVDKQFNETV